MSSHRVALLAFKLLGLWLMAQAALGAASMPWIWHSSPDGTERWTAALLALPWLVSLGIGVPVWFSADWFAARVFPGGQADAEINGNLRTEPLFAVGVAIIGLLLLVEGIPSLASALYLFSRTLQAGVLGPDESRERLLWDAQGKASALAGVTRVLLGCVLLAGPARLGAAVARVRKEFGGSLLNEETHDKK